MLTFKRKTDAVAANDDEELDAPDAELAAMATCLPALEPLSADGRARVLDYLARRLTETPPPADTRMSEPAPSPELHVNGAC